MHTMPLVVFFKQVDKNDGYLVGGKGANLGEMVQAGFPVPNGFCVTVGSYDLFLSESSIAPKISELLKGLDRNNSEELQIAAQKIQRVILTHKIPDQVAKQTLSSYKKLFG